MIIPSVVYKILSFIDKNGNEHKKPQPDANKTKVQLDNGQISFIYHYSGNKNFNSLNDYLRNKAFLGIKKNKAKELMNEILIERPEKLMPYLDSIIKAIRQSNPNIQNSQIQKQAAERLANQILLNKSLMQSASIVRSAIAFKENLSETSVKSIYTKFKDGKLIYDTSGVYAQALLPNHIPIELNIVRNREGQEQNFYKLDTSNIIKAEQIFMLLEHTLRTISKSINECSRAYLPYFYNEGQMPFGVVRLNEIKKIAQSVPNEQVLDINLQQEYFNILSQVLTELKQNNRYFLKFKISLPLVIEKEKHMEGLKSLSQSGGKSPIQQFRNAAVNTNFSQETKEVKEQLKKYILDVYMKPLVSGIYNPKMILTYNIAGNPIIGEGTSWGFMHQNIDYSKITFGIDDSIHIIKDVENYLLTLKN